MDTRNLNFSYKKVSIKKLNEISANGGNVLKYLDKEHTNFVSFGETYFSCINFDFIKGWKRHKEATLNIAVLVGEIKFVIFDDRKKEPGEFMEFVLSRKRFNLLTVPPMCWMAFKGLGKGESILINTIDIMHDPEEAENINISEIKYDWG